MKTIHRPKSIKKDLCKFGWICVYTQLATQLWRYSKRNLVVHQLFTAVWSEVDQIWREAEKTRKNKESFIDAGYAAIRCRSHACLRDSSWDPRGKVSEMKIIIHQKVHKNVIAMVYNACRRNHNGVKRKQKRSDGRPVAPWLLFKGGIVQRGVKMSWRNEFSVWCKIPQVIPVETLHNTNYKRKSFILITQASEESRWVIY